MITITIQKIAITVYCAAVSLLAMYAVHAGLLTVIAILHKLSTNPHPDIVVDYWPTVTVQIPLRNEPYVVKRIMQCVAALDYPHSMLQVHILDDSDDATTTVAETFAQQLRGDGLNIEVIHRDQPDGYKAGALRDDLRRVDSDFIALFDADFVPEADFLKRTIPALVQCPNVGMVQARWTHLNTKHNAFTRAQSLGLDAHFLIDHPARNTSGLLMNFNGSAGVWRKQAIIDAGGWSGDTLTEDLDLSYRTQLKGWQMIYLPTVTVGAELPPIFVEVKAQQQRWAKGAAQSLRKLVLPILISHEINKRQKVFALLHLSGYFSQMAMLVTLLASLPLTLLPETNLPGWLSPLSLVVSLTAVFYYLSSQLLNNSDDQRTLTGNILHYPVFLAMGLSTSLNISLALLDGLFKSGGEFVRTEKYNLSDAFDTSSEYRAPPTRIKHATEYISLAYAGLVLLSAIVTGNHQFTHLSVAYIAALCLIGILDIVSRRKLYGQQKTG